MSSVSRRAPAGSNSAGRDAGLSDAGSARNGPLHRTGWLDPRAAEATPLRRWRSTVTLGRAAALPSGAVCSRHGRSWLRPGAAWHPSAEPFRRHAAPLTRQAQQLGLSQLVVVQVQPAQAAEALQPLQGLQPGVAGVQLGDARQQLVRAACGGRQGAGDFVGRHSCCGWTAHTLCLRSSALTTTAGDSPGRHASKRHSEHRARSSNPGANSVRHCKRCSHERDRQDACWMTRTYCYLQRCPSIAKPTPRCAVMKTPALMADCTHQNLSGSGL